MLVGRLSLTTLLATLVVWPPEAGPIPPFGISSKASGMTQSKVWTVLASPFKYKKHMQKLDEVVYTQTV